MLLTTTPTIEGHKILSYKGIVNGEVIFGTNIVRDLLASIRDVVGGRSGSYETVLIEGRANALKEMEERAARMGANAVVGIDIDYETIGESMIMVSATGTAVTID